jgi:D-glycero-D-manno-heptose 1,7-bisphosphate phosphatase
MTIKTIFLDRDGVINLEKNYLHKIDDFEFISGVFNACNYYENLGYKIIIVTNQSGISRGYYSAEDYEILTNWMINQFKSRKIEILDTFHCPHSPNDKCKCRKPMPGMLLEAQKKYRINMANSWLIGDKEEDIIAAHNSGINNTIIVRSGHKIDELNSKAKYILNSIDESVKVILD